MSRDIGDIFAVVEDKRGEIVEKIFNDILGSGNWTIESLQGRCSKVIRVDGTEVFYLDKKPIIQFNRLEFDQPPHDECVFTVRISYEKLYE